MLKDRTDKFGRNIYRVVNDIKRKDRRVDPYLWNNIQEIVEILKINEMELGVYDIAKKMNKGVGNINIACLKAVDLGLIVCSFKQVHNVPRSFYSIKKSGADG